MIYTKSGNMAYNLHIIKTKRFKTVSIHVNFKRKFTKEGITKRNLLGEVLLESTKKHPTRRDIILERENLYNASYLYQSVRSGNFAILEFRTSFLNDTYTEEGNAAKAIDFLNEIIFEPNILNDQFDVDSFNRSKDFMIEEIESGLEVPRRHAMKRFLEEFYSNSPLQYIGPGYMEDLKQITPSSLYEYYKSVLNSDIVDIFICGDVDPKSMEQLFRNRFQVKTIKKKNETHIVVNDKLRKRAKIVKEKKNIKQSNLIIGCKLPKLNDYERKYVGRLYSYILGGGAESLLFQNLRENNSLCYTINSTFSSVDHNLVIKAGIDSTNFKKAVALIKKSMKQIEEGKFPDQMLQSFKLINQTARKEILDTPIGIINLYRNHEYLGTDLLEEMEKQQSKLTKEDIIKFSQKVKIDTIYLLEGGSINE